MKNDRRSFLRGLGTLVALPALEYFGAPIAEAQAGQAKRVFFFYVPNGANFAMQGGGAFNLSNVLSPLNSVKDYVTVVNGLNLQGARVPRAGDHARAAGAFLTCAEPQHPGPGVDKSFDQVLAGSIGSSTRLGSLTIGAETGGGSDSGYAPSYVANISWLSASSPNTKETDPIAVFNRLFAGGTAAEQVVQETARFKYGKSVLDFVREEAKSLSGRLGDRDQAKLDEYLTSVREMETRVGSSAVVGAGCQEVARPTFNGGFEQRVGAMYDLSYHALSCGMTRVGSFLLANEASNVSYGFAGVNGGHHEISHDSSADGRARIDTIVKWHVTQLAKFAERLRGTAEGSGNMLDNSILVFGSGIGDGARHNHDQLPILVVGRGGGIQSGRVVEAANAPLANLYVTIGKAMGASLERFADSTGPLSLG